MNVLISAYACEPGKGSEPGVGWEWIRRLSNNHNLWVLTRANNREAIEAARDQIPCSVHFVYVDLPCTLRFWKRGNRGVNLYYLIWQALAFFRARRLVSEYRIDVAHHVTLMSVTRFSFVPLLGVPSVVGPVGGLQMCPAAAWPLIKNKLRERIRNLSIRFLNINPLFRFGIARASKIVLATQSGAEHLPVKLRDTKVSFSQIGSTVPQPPPKILSRPQKNSFVALWAGRLEDHKGFEILIYAVKHLVEIRASVLESLQVIVTGSGPELSSYQDLIKKFSLSQFFKFHGWLTRDAYESLWTEVDIFTFTSLRETTGVVLQEAMLRGKPAVVLANGGPGEMVTTLTGVPIMGESLEQIATNFAEAIQFLYKHPKIRYELGDAARTRATRLYSWESTVEFMERVYAEISKKTADVALNQ